MGCTLSINIQLEKDTYYPGEKVKGALSLDLPKPIRAREVQLVFVGKEHTRVVRGSGDDSSVYVEEHNIVEHVVSVWQPSPNGYLGPCNDICPFEFQLPDNAVPSMVVKNNDDDTITYQVKAKIDKPLAFDPNVEFFIQVLPMPIETCPASQLIETFQEPTGMDYLEVTVDKNVFISGEWVTGRVKFKKDPGMKVRGVECAVSFTESATARNHTDSYSFVVGAVRWEIDPRSEYHEWPFQIQTYPSGDYSVEGNLIQRRWMIDVKVDLPLKRDQHLIIPLLFIPLRSPVTP